MSHLKSWQQITLTLMLKEYYLEYNELTLGMAVVVEMKWCGSQSKVKG